MIIAELKYGRGMDIMYSVEGLIITIGFMLLIGYTINGIAKEVRQYRMIREYKRLFPEVWK